MEKNIDFTEISTAFEEKNVIILENEKKNLSQNKDIVHKLQEGQMLIPYELIDAAYHLNGSIKITDKGISITLPGGEEEEVENLKGGHIKFLLGGKTHSPFVNHKFKV